MPDDHSIGSRAGLVRPSPASDVDQPSEAEYQPNFRPGLHPIGYMSARGTPYERKYMSRKLGCCCLFVLPPLLIIVAVITLIPVLYGIANHALHTSQFHIYASNITSPTNTSFPLSLQAQVKKVGIFPAVIHFREPIDVYWNTPRPDMREVHLGSFDLARISAANGHGTVNEQTLFNIDDQEAFGLFTGWLVSKEEFTWQIRSKNLHVEAFNFLPTYKNLAITKNVVIKGINNFGNVEILDLQLPGAHPDGGITIISTTKLVNPSPFGVQVGTLNIDLFYNGLYLGPVAAEGLNITAGSNIVTLRGRLLPQDGNATALAILGNLFTNYVNSVPSDVVAVGRTVKEANGDEISWLATGIKQLNAHVRFVPPEPINPIKGITIGTINLEYSEDLPYNPMMSSGDLVGTFQLPFGFPLNITQLATSLSIIMDGAKIGSADGAFGPSSTKINSQSQAQTSGDIMLVLPPTMLVLPNTTDAAKQQLIAFQRAFVYTDGTGFEAQGAARAVTQTPVGEILLDGIKFDVGTGLKGLSGLTRYATVINSVDVMGGTKDSIKLAVALTVINPSNLNLSTKDVTLQLINRDVLGSTMLPDLHLLPGRNDINAIASFDPNVSPYGLETLNRFISGMDTTLNASGFAASSKIVSLSPVLAGLRLNTTLPGLQKSLVQAANLTVLDTTGVSDDIANSIVQLANPFNSSLGITRIVANASTKGIFLAQINTPLQFTAGGRATTASPNVPLALNLFPPDIFAVLRAYAVDSGQDPAYIDGLVQLAGITLTPTRDQPAAAAKLKRALGGAESTALAGLERSSDYLDANDELESTKRALPLIDGMVRKRDNLYTGFDLRAYVGRAFSVAKADLSIEADASIGEYGSTLTFIQSDVPLGTDDTLFKLLPVLAKPIVQAIVDKAVLNIDRVTITEARPDGFTAMLQGALTDAGPFDAIVSFPKGLMIYWKGQLLTQTVFPNITLVGDLGAKINVQLEGRISDVGFFTDFLRSAITDPSFLWDIRGTGISVDALGISVSDIALTKSIQLTGLNGLRGGVIINSFDLPSNDPAGGIHLTAISTINNPAQVGVALSSFGVMISMGDTDLGPSAAAKPFTLQALGVTDVPLVGRLQEQTSQTGLSDLSTLFTRFVHNQNTDLIVQGVSAGPPDVVWLNNGIKALRVAVVLPSQDFQVIRVISLNSLALYFTVPTAWGPRTDSSNTTANFFLPFAFPVDITQVQGPFTANYQNTDMAVLNIPASPTKTDVEARILTLAFQNVPFAVFGNAHPVFSQFAADFVAREQVTFGLHGATTAKLGTAAGALTIADIPFNVGTNLLGLQGLNARPATVSHLDVFHGYPTYLQINVDTALFNPSDTTIGAGDVSFAVDFQNSIIGNAVIKNILLPPGELSLPTEIDYMPMGAANIAAGQNLLENYVQNVTSAVVVRGTSQTTPIQSLVQALEQIELRTTIPPLGQLLVQRTFLTVPKDIAQTGGKATVTVTLNNPFTANIALLRINALANFQDITIGTIDADLAAASNIFFAPGHQVTTSESIPIVLDVRPKNLLRFILAAAQAYEVSLGPLPPFFQKVLDLPGEAKTQVSPFPDDSPPPCRSGKAFDTLGAIKALLAPLAVSIPIKSTLKLDDFQTNLNFIQQPVPVGTDDTALYLVGPAAAPLIQLIVDQATLSVTRANATALTNDGFTASLIGALLTDAPADAYIEAPDGLAVEFQGKDIAMLTLPALCTNVPDGIPTLSLVSQLTITDQGAFADFAYFLLTEPSFQWRLHSDTVTVRTLGIKFSKVSLSKTIQLDAFNGLPGIVITSFATTGDLNGNAIGITTGVSIPSQASLGVELGEATLDLIFKETNIGQASSTDLFLAYKATTDAVLMGYLRRQDRADSLAALGVLFTQYLAGEDSALTIRGKQVISPASGGEPVGWLTKAFQRFSTTTVLPGKIYQIIYAITLSDLEIFLQTMDEDFMVPATNKLTTATFANPLLFSLSVLNLKPSIIIEFEGADTATLDLPTIDSQSGVSTGPTVKQDLTFGFQRQIVRSTDNRASFQAFFAKLTDTKLAEFILKGSTDVLAHTVIGDIPIQRIPFNVRTSLAGIDSFGGSIKITSSSVDKPTKDYLSVSLETELMNPSQLTVHTTGISLPAFYQTDTNIGRATIDTLDLLPGNNVVPILFELQIIPFNDTKVQDVLRLYVSSSDLMTEGSINTIALDVHGIDGAKPVTSPFETLQPALTGLNATTSLDGIGSLVISQVRVYLGADLIADAIAQLLGGLLGETVEDIPAYVYGYIDSVNKLPSGIHFNAITATVFKQNEDESPFAQFTDTFDIDLPPKSDKTTFKVTNIFLTQGVLASLELVDSPIDLATIIDLDLYQAADSGSRYNIPGLSYDQHSVDTLYFVGTGADDGIPLALFGSDPGEPADPEPTDPGTIDPASGDAGTTDSGATDSTSGDAGTTDSGAADTAASGTADAASAASDANSKLPASQELRRRASSLTAAGLLKSVQDIGGPLQDKVVARLQELAGGNISGAIDSLTKGLKSSVCGSVDLGSLLGDPSACAPAPAAAPAPATTSSSSAQNAPSISSKTPDPTAPKTPAPASPNAPSSSSSSADPIAPKATTSSPDKNVNGTAT